MISLLDPFICYGLTTHFGSRFPKKLINTSILKINFCIVWPNSVESALFTFSLLSVF